MAKQTNAQLKAAAQTIKNETVTEANTATRVGTLLENMADSLENIDSRVQTVASAATVTPNADENDSVNITNQAVGLTLANPTGTPTHDQGLIIRIKDNGTARSISFGTAYAALGVALPTTTIINKMMVLAFLYDSGAARWQLINVVNEI